MEMKTNTLSVTELNDVMKQRIVELFLVLQNFVDTKHFISQYVLTITNNTNNFSNCKHRKF